MFASREIKLYFSALIGASNAVPIEVLFLQQPPPLSKSLSAPLELQTRFGDKKTLELVWHKVVQQVAEAAFAAQDKNKSMQ